jgi:hypothetical protein
MAHGRELQPARQLGVAPWPLACLVPQQCACPSACPGKTETTKKAMQYFATLAGGTGVEDQVLEVRRAERSPSSWGWALEAAGGEPGGQGALEEATCAASSADQPHS